MKKDKYIVTGGLGFIGSNISQKILKKKFELIIIDNLTRIGSEKNLKWLKQFGKFQFYKVDIKNSLSVEKIINKHKPKVIFHLAGQVAMTTSLKNPKKDFETNVLGTINILEAVKKYSTKSIIIYSSSNKVYGELNNTKYIKTKTRYTLGNKIKSFDELTKLDFQSPYGCSKGAADQYILDYHRSFNIKTVVFRHSTVFGDRQFSNSEQGWIGWFIKEALSIKNGLSNRIEISGDGKQVRDILFVSDLVECYFLSIKNIKNCAGKSYNIGGGLKNSISIIELFNFLEKELKIKINIKNKKRRKNDQLYFVANIKKAFKDFGWKPKINKDVGIKKMINWSKINKEII